MSDATPAQHAAGRAAARASLTLDMANAKVALEAAITDAYAAGLLVGGQQAGAEVIPALDMVTPSTPAGWASFWDAWTPGNAPAASLLQDGGLADLLAQSDTVISGIEGTTLDRLGNLLADGVAQGLGVDEIAAGMGDFLDDPERAYRIADTETARAVSEASMNQYTAAGVQEVEWLVSPGACEICEGLAGGSPYLLLDAPLQPQHPMCRCSYSPKDPGMADSGEEVNVDE